MGYATYSSTTIFASLRGRLGNLVFWNDNELLVAITESLRTWNLLTGDWGGRHIGILGTTPFLTLPSTILSSTRVEYQSHPLIQTSLRDLDDGKPGWQTTTGIPRYWAPVALNLIAIYPTMVIADNSITVDGIIATPTISLPAQQGNVDTYIDLDAALFDILLDYARHILLLKLGGDEFEQSKAARKTLWEFAGHDNQRIQASAPYRSIMGLPLDSTRQPLMAGDKKVGLR